MLIITPFLRALHERGDRVTLITNDIGLDLLRNDPHVAEMVKQPDLPDDHKRKAYYEGEAEKRGAALYVLHESLEASILLAPLQPNYTLTKPERARMCDQSFYAYVFKHAGVPIPDGWTDADLRPRFYSTRPERRRIEREMIEMRGPGFLVLVGLSGSGAGKRYAYLNQIIGQILQDYSGARVVVTADISGDAADMSDHFPAGRYFSTCRTWGVRDSFVAAAYADLVIAPDTALLHAAGEHPVPKVGILGPTTRRQVTQHFENDYSIEADPRLAECAPCFRIIYDKWLQCPVDEGPSCANDGPDTPCGRTHAVMCMSRGLPPERVYDRVQEAIGNHIPEERREARRHRHLSLVRP